MSRHNGGSKGDGSFASLVLPGSKYINYNYDDSGHIFQIRYPGSYKYRNISYLPNGWSRSIQDPTYPGGYRYHYYYYDNGNIDYITSWAGTDDFNYDANGRLTYWKYTPLSGNPVQENYQYDPAGNLLAGKHGGCVGTVLMLPFMFVAKTWGQFLKESNGKKYDQYGHARSQKRRLSGQHLSNAVYS